MFKAAACQILTGSGFSCIELDMSENKLGIISIIVGLVALGMSFTASVITIIPIILACALAIFGLMDYLSYKWSPVTGLILAGAAVVMLVYWGNSGKLDTSLQMPRFDFGSSIIADGDDSISEDTSFYAGNEPQKTRHSVIPWAMKLKAILNPTGPITLTTGSGNVTTNGIIGGTGTTSSVVGGTGTTSNTVGGSGYVEVGYNDSHLVPRNDGKKEYSLIGYWKEINTNTKDHYAVSAVIDYDTITTYYYTNDLLKGSYSLQWSGSYRNLVDGQAWVSKGYYNVMAGCYYASKADNKTFSYDAVNDTISYSIDFGDKDIQIILGRVPVVGGISVIGKDNTSYVDSSVYIMNAKEQAASDDKNQSSVSGNDTNSDSTVGDKTENNSNSETNGNTENSGSSGTSDTTNDSSSSSSSTVIVPDSEDTQGDLVWVPTNGGTKYHTKSSCSMMDNPMQVTREHAEANGYTPCEKCY